MNKMIENYKSKLNYKELIQLQTMFRDGLIREEDLREEVIEDLEKLYHNQIDRLKQSIEKNKQEIIKIRKVIKC